LFNLLILLRIWLSLTASLLELDSIMLSTFWIYYFLPILYLCVYYFLNYCLLHPQCTHYQFDFRGTIISINAEITIVIIVYTSFTNIITIKYVTNFTCFFLVKIILGKNIPRIFFIWKNIIKNFQSSSVIINIIILAIIVVWKTKKISKVISFY